MGDAIDAWLAVAAPHATYSVAELASPAGEYGEPMLVVAIEPGPGQELDSVMAALASLNDGGLTHPGFRLHLATR